MGWLRRTGEVIDEALCIRHPMVYDPRESPLVMGIVGIESLNDKFSVRLVLGEDDRLPNAIAASYLEPSRHQVFEDLVDRVLVEEPLVDGWWFDPCRSVAVIVPLDCIP